MNRLGLAWGLFALMACGGDDGGGGGDADAGRFDGGGGADGGSDAGRPPDAPGTDSGRAADATYDVIVVGAGTGGIGTAIQAARMGANVVILEETDWIGGQM